MMLRMFQNIVTQGLSPNSFYTLLSIYNKEAPKKVNLELELRSLEGAGYIADRRITQKGIDLVKELSEKYKTDKQGNLVKVKKFTEEQMAKVTEYREIFPKGILPSGQPSRVPLKELEKKFLWFLLTYDYSWETILKATKKYVSEYAAKNYEYMKTSGYFVSKTEKGAIVSTLASYCDMIEDGDEPTQTNAYQTHSVL